MQKAIVIFASLGIAVSWLSFAPKSISAQGYCAGNWDCTCDDNSGATCNNCPSGQYCLPDGSCHNLGDATPPPGGGGDPCVPPTDCPAGWTPSFNQAPIKIRRCDESDLKLCSLGTAQKYIGCCGNENDDGSCMRQNNK
jgi:hypothetical protein